MLQNKLYFTVWQLLIAVFAAQLSPIASAEQLSPPTYKVLDRFGVNHFAGQVATSLDTIAIGGSMGLTHDISTHSNSYLRLMEYELSQYFRIFDDVSWYGYNDKFGGNARHTLLGHNIYVDGVKYLNFYIMKVFDPLGSAEFKTLVNGVVNPDVDVNETNVTFEPLGDQRHSLIVNGGYLDWTKPDGTVTKFKRQPDAGPTRKAHLDKIIYPNGHTLSVTKKGLDTVHNVSSNTGFQLKYVYELDSRPLVASKTGRTSDPHVPANSLRWAANNPKHIIGINRAVEYCSPSAVDQCNLQHEWPKATFEWPAGMPRAFFIDESIFKVTDDHGQTTEYHINAHDKSLLDDAGHHLVGSPGQNFVPRIVGVKPGASDDITVKYTYGDIANKISHDHVELSLELWYMIEVGRLMRAEGETIGVSQYRANQVVNGLGDFGTTGGAEVKSVALYPSMPGKMYYLKTQTNEMMFERSYRNFPLANYPVDGPFTYFFYDERGNLKYEVSMPNDGACAHVYDYNFPAKCDARKRVIEAKYADTCTNANRKFCNKAEWISDGKGNKTHYTYHPESGQVASVTYPANDSGVSAQTRYEYAEHYAFVKDSNNNRKQASTPIWLKVAERYCINSNYSGACAANDEVLTSFEYNHDNLFLTGVIVSSGSESRATCYQYDKYGNSIGETKPSGTNGTCSQ